MCLRDDNPAKAHGSSHDNVHEVDEFSRVSCTKNIKIVCALYARKTVGYGFDREREPTQEYSNAASAKQTPYTEAKLRGRRGRIRCRNAKQRNRRIEWKTRSVPQDS